MKTTIISTIVLFLFMLSASSQNRIAGWDGEKITSITLTVNSPDGDVKTIEFSTQKELNSIISFLEKVDFKAPVRTSNTRGAADKPWKYHLVFNGLRDQVYLFPDHAFIGKSDYSIDASVLTEFKDLLAKL